MAQIRPASLCEGNSGTIRLFSLTVYPPLVLNRLAYAAPPESADKVRTVRCVELPQSAEDALPCMMRVTIRSCLEGVMHDGLQLLWKV